MASSSNTGSFISIEKLKGMENYSSWKFHMKMILIHEDLWDYVETDGGDSKKQQKALAKIALSVQPAAIPHIRNASTAHQAWNNLQKAYEDKGLCRRLGLLRTMFSTKLSESESMEAYLNKITEISQQLYEIGSGLEDDFIAVIMLSGLSGDYDPLIMAMENSNVKLSSEVVKGKLLQENLRRDDKIDSTGSALMARKKTKPRCFRCKKVGHFIKDCNKSANDKNLQSNQSRALLSALTANIKNELWYIDSGASEHMCRDRSIMSDFVSDNKSLIVKLANGDRLYTAGRGSVQVTMKNGIIKTISNVYYVPNLTTNLLSVSAIIKKGFKVVFSSSNCQIYDGKVIIATATLYDGIYQLDTIESTQFLCNFVENKNASSFSGYSSADRTSKMNKSHEDRSILTYEPKQPVAVVAMPVPACEQQQQDTHSLEFRTNTPACKDAVASHEVWHRRLAHLNHRSMQLLKQGMVTGISYNNGNFLQCIACIEGKQTRLPFPKKSFNRATDILELVHTDLCGPMSCTSFSGSKYFLIFIDDYTRKTFCYFLNRKDEVFDKFKIWKALVENQTNKKLKAIRSDNGCEYMSSKFQNFLRDNGIQHQTTVPYSPQQNGVAERANRSIMEKARCMLQEAGLKQQYWAEAVNTAVYIKNRSPTIAVKGVTPEEKWTNKKVSISHLRIFGCIAYAQRQNALNWNPKQTNIYLSDIVRIVKGID